MPLPKLIADHDAIEEMMRRRGVASTVRLVAQVTTSIVRHTNITNITNPQTHTPSVPDTAEQNDPTEARPVHPWEITQGVLDRAAAGIERAMLNVAREVLSKAAEDIEKAMSGVE